MRTDAHELAPLEEAGAITVEHRERVIELCTLRLVAIDHRLTIQLAELLEVDDQQALGIDFTAAGLAEIRLHFTHGGRLAEAGERLHELSFVDCVSPGTHAHVAQVLL